jgi:hypothetical protein
MKLKMKFRERLLPHHGSPKMGVSEKAHRRITGITSGNATGVSAETIPFEKSRAHLVQIAEIEVKRAQALAESYLRTIR